MTMVMWWVLAAAPWSLVSNADGVELYQRDVAGERVVELKVVTVSKLPVDALCTSAFGSASIDPAEPAVTARKLISFENGVRITYEQVSAPIVSDRDYAVLARKEALPNGGCRTRFEAANQHAPKLPAGFVRIEKLWGGWTFEPVAGGNVVCTYTVFSDPAGSIPAMLVEGTRRDTALQWVKLVLERAKKAPAQGDAGRD